VAAEVEQILPVEEALEDIVVVFLANCLEDKLRPNRH
jgi:hypothetical protein